MAGNTRVRRVAVRDPVREKTGPTSVTKEPRRQDTTRITTL